MGRRCGKKDTCNRRLSEAHGEQRLSGADLADINHQEPIHFGHRNSRKVVVQCDTASGCMFQYFRRRLREH